MGVFRMVAGIATSRFARGAFVAAFVWVALVEVVEFTAGALFGMQIDGDWYLLLAGSSSGDRSQFVRINAAPLALAVSVFAVASAAAAWAAFRSSRRVFVCILAASAVAVAARAASVGSIRAWKPVYVAFDTVRGARSYAQVGDAGRWTPERAAAAKPAPQGATNYVFIVGESMTTWRLPQFGYAKDTTPRLSALGGALAARGPVRAPSPYTVTSLIRLMVHDGVAAPVAFRMAGWHTGFLGAHAKRGRYCSIEVAIFSSCERKVYLSDVNGDAKIYDEQVLPYVKEMTAQEPFALFVHLMGSHFPPEERVPPGFAEGLGLDDYDRSVRYEDEVLARIVEMLPPRTELFFISDHGESVDRGGWRDARSEALWSVPLFAYPASAAPESISDADGFVEIWRSRLPQDAGHLGTMR